MKLVDTNVFIYALGLPHEYKDACSRLSSELLRGQHDANIDAELLQEVLHFFWRRRHADEGLNILDRLLAGFPDPIAIGSAEMRVARDVFASHSNLAPRDAIHAAVVLVHRLEGIISTDRGFDTIPGITRFDPKSV